MFAVLTLFPPSREESRSLWGGFFDGNFFTPPLKTKQRGRWGTAHQQLVTIMEGGGVLVASV